MVDTGCPSLFPRRQALEASTPCPHLPPWPLLCAALHGLPSWQLPGNDGPVRARPSHLEDTVRPGSGSRTFHVAQHEAELDVRPCPRLAPPLPQPVSLPSVPVHFLRISHGAESLSQALLKEDSEEVSFSVQPLWLLWLPWVSW